MSATKVRKGPEESATKFVEGTHRKGNDGRVWVVSETSAGIRRWVPAKEGAKPPAPRHKADMKFQLIATPVMKEEREERLRGVLRLAGGRTKICGSQDAESAKGPVFNTYRGEYLVWWTQSGFSRIRANQRMPPANMQFRVEFIPVNGDMMIFDPTDAHAPESFIATSGVSGSSNLRNSIEALGRYRMKNKLWECTLLKCTGQSDIFTYGCPERRARMCIVGYVKAAGRETAYLFEFPRLL